MTVCIYFLKLCIVFPQYLPQMPSTYELAEAHRLPQPLLFFFSEASYPSGSEILAFLREDEPGCVVASTLGRTLLK